MPEVIGCPHCGASTSAPEAEYCGECGMPLSMGSGEKSGEKSTSEAGRSELRTAGGGSDRKSVIRGAAQLILIIGLVGGAITENWATSLQIAFIISVVVAFAVLLVGALSDWRSYRGGAQSSMTKEWTSRVASRGFAYYKKLVLTVLIVTTVIWVLNWLGARYLLD